MHSLHSAATAAAADVGPPPFSAELPLLALLALPALPLLALLALLVSFNGSATVLFLHSPSPLHRTVCRLPQSHSSGSHVIHVHVAFLSRVSSIVFLLVKVHDVA